VFKNIRILVLLLILFAVILNANLTKSDATDWREPLVVSIYPMNGDGSRVTTRYIEQMDADYFRSIEQFMTKELNRFDIPQQKPVKIFLRPEITDLPPKIAADRNVLDVMWWSLLMRYWSFQIGKLDGDNPDIQMFVFYYDPSKNRDLEHSFGLEKGMIGVVNAYATTSMNEKNNFVITHEILHTLGATDKYHLATGQPIHPDGYAEPYQIPRYPQIKAEIMGGRVVLNAQESEMPNGLREAIIGIRTAMEIGLLSYDAGGE